MGRFEYKDPLKQGYVLTSISLKDLKRLGIAQWRSGWVYKAAVFWSEARENFIIEYLSRGHIKALTVLLLPISLVICGIANYKEVWRDSLKVVQERKLGGYSSDIVYRRDKSFESLNELRKSKG